MACVVLGGCPGLTNKKPEAFLPQDLPDTGRVGDEMTLSVSASDPDGNSLSYQWYASVFGNSAQSLGGSVSEPEFSFTPELPGIYSVYCRVSDGHDSVNTASRTIVVRGSWYFHTGGKSGRLETSGTGSNPEYRIWIEKLQINTGRFSVSQGQVRFDGKGLQLLVKCTISQDVMLADLSSVIPDAPFAFAAPDPAGNNPPTLNFSLPDNAAPGRAVSLTASASDPDGGPLVCLWKVNGDIVSPPSFGRSASFTPLDPGVYDVECQISDGFETVILVNQLNVL